MTKKYVGQRIKRNEDPRLLTGQALFMDDIELPGLLHAAFLRSDYAHARIKSIDTSAAFKRPGVVAVYTAEDFGDYWHPGPLQVPPPLAIAGAVFNTKGLPPIGKDKVRFSGEPLAVIIAESRYIAEDAFNDIVVDLEPLDVVTDLEKALEPGTTLVHDDLGTNLAADVKQESGNYAAARAKADVVIKRRFNIDRGASGAMENRGLIVDWDEKSQHMTVWSNCQAPIPIRNTIAANLGLSDSQVRVITPFVGGGFGPKIMTSQADDVLLPWISMRLKRPIKWIEDRRENFLATTSERDQIHDCELALTTDGKILGFSDIFYHNTGAYDPYGMTVPLNTQTHTTGSYNVPNFYTQVIMVFTNEMVVTPVRGAGRMYGNFVMERMLDIAAKEMKIDPVELRRRNLIQPNQFPVKTGIIGQDFVENVLDSGNYPATLQKVLDIIGYEKFVKEELPRLRAQGKQIGIGVVCFVEGTAVGPYEGARVNVDGTGKVTVVTGVSTQGQGHYTTFAQIVAEQLGVKVSDVRVITGDTGHFHWGAGTFASRGATVAGNAINNAATKVRSKILKLASKLLETPEDELELDSGVVRVADIPQKSITLGELAWKANPTRGTIDPNMEPGLEATAFYGPPHGATGQGTVAMVVEIDPETMLVKINRFVIAHDCGTVINPLILDGQIQGGVSMGIGNAFYEKMVYDENGQLLNASLMDYLLPLSTDMPPKIELGHLETPSPLNPMGSKGVGEAGAIPTPACFVQAVENALMGYNVEILESPLSPNRLWELVQKR
ncbi:MAG: xanthine dehydrogenase family protein molybdopterin-binding subunit [Anaerolineales bacterium]|nr:xanthine dehydrogenase family protein molybdopterin-binding subunit [Anaerolineales bacterium]